MKPAPSAWNRCSASTAFTPTRASAISPSIRTCCCITRKRRTGRFWKKASPRRAPWPPASPPGTAYANYGVPMIPFYIYYSMFGYQRVGDLVWAFADSRGKGFLMGGTSGRTTLLGRGIAASGRPQPAAVQRRPHLRRLRSGLRLRAGGDHSGRHPAHVSGDGRPLLLHLRLQRKLSRSRRCPASRMASRPNCARAF